MSLAGLALMAGALLAASGADPGASSVRGISFELSRGEGTDRCPDRDSLAARVKSRLAETGGTARKSADQHVEVTIVRIQTEYVGTVTVLGAEGGTRRLLDTSEDCAGLAEALVLLLSMVADGQPLAVGKQPDAPAAAQSARAWEVGAGAVASAKLLGDPSLGVALDAAVYPRPRLAIGVGVLWMPSRAIDTLGSTSEVQVVAALARVCWGPWPYGGRVFPAVCGNLGAGALRGEGDIAVYADARSIWRPWLAAGGTLHAGIRLHRRLTFAVHAGYLFSLVREHFTAGVADQQHQVYESGDPGFTGGAGLLVRIP